jgi:two-component system chemotaxis response regulator CheB
LGKTCVAESDEDSSALSPAVVAIGASAGGVSAIAELVGALPADFGAAVLVVLHVNPTGTSVLPQILGRAGPLPAAHATQGERLQAGVIRVAPPDHHLLTEGCRIRLHRGPRINGHRPAVDTLFGSVARSHGKSAVGIVLSGTMDDGTIGLGEIKLAGGITFAQDPQEAEFSAMPSAAVEAGVVDHRLPVKEIASMLCVLPLDPVEPGGSGGSGGSGGATGLSSSSQLSSFSLGGAPLGFSCPDCGGVLEQQAVGAADIFRCRVGHQYSLESLVVVHAAALDESLWAGYRSLKEQAELCRRLASRLHGSTGEGWLTYQRRAEDADRRADTIHRLLTQTETQVADTHGG